MSYQIITKSNSNNLTNLSITNTTFSIREEIDLSGISNFTSGANNTLKFEGGSFINYNTITGVNTTIDAGLNQIFFGSELNFLGTWATKKTYPQWFGVIGNNKTDDQSNLEKMIGFISNLSGYKEFYIPENLICIINRSLDLSNIENINIKGQVVLKNSINSPSIDEIEKFSEKILIGTTSIGSNPLNVFISRVQGCCIKISGTVHSNITINSAPKLEICGDGDTKDKYSVAYNKFYLGPVKVLLITSTNGNRKGWVNENKFFGGNIKKLSIEGTYPCNNNIFYGTMFEGFMGYFEKGYSNYFYDVRFEGQLDLTFLEEVFDTRFYKSYHPKSDEFLKKRNFKLPVEKTNYSIKDYGELNGIVHHADITNKDRVIFEMNRYTNNFDTNIFGVEGDDLKIIGNPFQEFYDTGKFKLSQHPTTKLPQPISIKIFSDIDFADATLQLFDINGNLIDQNFFDNNPTNPNDLVNLLNIGGQWKGYNNLNWYQFNDNIIPSSSGKGVFPIFPKKAAYYAQLKIRLTSNERLPVSINNFSIIVSESKDYNTVIGRILPNLGLINNIL